ncbi:MAG: hypothetical protein ACHQ01_02345 [Candidatus Limnocylindrales bacterium]
MNESMAHPNRFLADLTQAMRLTAEAAHQSSLEQIATDARTYEERLRSGTTNEAMEMRSTAEADVAAIRKQSRIWVERARLQSDQRISRRRESLESDLQELTSAVDVEIDSVAARVSAFEKEVAEFFDQLLQGVDPAVFATMASQVPDPPVFGDLGPEGLLSILRARDERVEMASPAEPEPGPEAAPRAKEASDHWWMDSPSALAARMQARRSS